MKDKTLVEAAIAIVSIIAISFTGIAVIEEASCAKGMGVLAFFTVVVLAAYSHE